MSPRSTKFLLQARERLAGARDALASGHPDLGASAAYYAMLGDPGS
ncbi:MAG: HEPN domain-containing protein [Actinomycetota bacterium]|nr:HEPN domain-containing protein [Actinomycetota bacterium]